MNTRLWMVRIGIGAVTLGVAPAWAAPIVVTTTADTVAADGACSLREAVNAINSQVTVNECVFPGAAPTSDIAFSLPLPSTVTLGSALTLTRSMNITGQGEANTVLDGNNAVGIFSVPVRSTVHLSGMTLQHALGGAVLNAGTVFLDRVTCQDSVLAGGGACLVNTSSASVDASATLTNSTFVRNNPGSVNATGGAIRNAGLLSVTGSYFQDNGASLGGAVATTPGARATSTTITSCSFVSNTAANQGGAISVATGQPLVVSRSVFRLNQAGAGVGGGAISTLGVATLSDSRFDHNTSLVAGGAVASGGSAVGAVVRMVVERCSFLNNNSVGPGGALWLSNNQALVATNVTMVGNGSNADGGAIYAAGANNIHLNNVTLVQNQSNTLATGSGTGGALFLGGGAATVQNSILSQNTDHGSTRPGPDCFTAPAGVTAAASMASNGYNIFGSLVGCLVTGPRTGDLTGTPLAFGLPSASAGPLLGASSSERVAVLPPAAGSMPINGGNPAGCTLDDGVAPAALTVDAQSNPRPVLQCDVGAQETPCGNLALDPGEACDDGNLANTDACLRTCVTNVCGDGQRNAATEQCDNGVNNSDTGACLLSCRLATCGDGHLQARVEQCDDGNVVDGDGCDHLCHTEGTASSSSGGGASSGPVASSSLPGTSSVGSSSRGSASSAGCRQPTLNQCEDVAYVGSECGQLAVANGWCVSVCPRSLTSTQCNDPAFGRTVCGRESVDNGACTAACSQASPDRPTCESDWMQSVCGMLEARRWANAINQRDLSLSACAALKAELIPNAGVLMANPPASTPGPVLMPLATIDGTGLVTQVPVRTHDNANVFPYRPSHMMHVGGTSTYRGWRTHQSVRAAGTLPNFDLADTLLDIQFKQAMNANGKRVNSCREYVFEKYWNFSKWEDETADAGNNWRRYVDVAYAQERGLPSGQLLPVSAIGTRGERNLPIRSRDGKALTKQVVFQVENTWKNIFFAVGPANPYASEPNPMGDAVREILGPLAADLPMCGASIYPGYLNLCSNDLAKDVYNGVHLPVTDRGWAYHHTKSTALRAAGYSDEDLYLTDGIKKRYEALLRLRGSLWAEFWGILSEPTHKRFLPQGTVLPDVLLSPDPAWSLIETMRGRMDTGGLVTSQVMPLNPAQTGKAAKGLLNGPLAGGTLGNMTLGLVQTALSQQLAAAQGTAAHPMAHHVGADPSALATHISAGGVIRPTAATIEQFRGDIFSLMKGLLYVDGLLEQALLEAKKYNCLALDDSNPCDWSPRDFAQAVVGYYAQDQEADYQRCKHNTAGGTFETTVRHRKMRLAKPHGKSAPDYEYPEIPGRVPNAHGGSDEKSFPCMLDPDGNLRADTVKDSQDAIPGLMHDCASFAVFGGNSPECNDWTKDTTHLDTYFQCVDALKRVVLKNVQQLGNLQDEKGRLRLSQSTGEDEQSGNDDFNLHYGYAFGWAMGGFDDFVDQEPGNACTLKPELYAHIKVGATALHHPVDLVEGSAHIRTSGYEGFPSLATDPATRDIIPDHLEFKVLGMDLFAPAPTNVTVSADIVKGQEEESQDFLRVTVPFALGPIPMSLTGGVTGRLGVKYGASAVLDTQGTCANTRITGYFTPYAAVDGYAEVGLDILVAAAGVKITLTIIEADLPFTVSAGLSMVDGFPGVTLDTNMDLVLSTLGGRFSVYLRIVLVSWDWTIFSWEGFKRSMNIFHAEMALQLEPLRMALKLLKPQWVE